MTDNPTTKRSPLIGVQAVTSQLTTGHPTDGVDEVSSVQVFKPVLIRVMGVGTTIKVMGRRIFDPVLVTSILENWSKPVERQARETYMVCLFIEHEGSNGPASIGTITSLTTNTNGSTANAELVDSAGDSMSRRRH